MSTPIYSYWGKAPREVPAEKNHHLLAYHCLDVAAVGRVFLQYHPALRKLLAERLGLSEETLIAWQSFFLALHDIGKFSERFQGMIQHWPNAERYTLRHDSLGWLLWREEIADYLLETNPLGLNLDDWEADDWFQDGLDYWAQAVTGHHGQPPEEAQAAQLSNQFSPDDRAAAQAFVAECACLLLPAQAQDLPPADEFARALRPLSWWLAGIAVLCDWIGSNQDVFEYCADPMPLADYWQKIACPKAEAALRQTGVLPLPAARHSLSELFDYLNPPTPLQHLAAELPLGKGLFILEDVTGAGKTEAALMLAHRLIADGAASGLYLGLPTMATSNAMFRRIQDKRLHRKFFTADPALLLAHSASRMQHFDKLNTPQETPRQAIVPDAPGEADYARNDLSAAHQRGGWLYDSRKKALLADFGVGTLDQALLAVLYSRHQALRLLGLAHKVLIVDEVHACDAYMHRLLEILLEFHASIGGSVILLSATLPQATRQSLVKAYCKGLGRKEAPQLAGKETYPLLTCVSADGHADEIPLETRQSVARAVQVTFLYQAGQVQEILLQVIAAGHCACWIRNTVADAVEAFDALRQAGVPAESLDLFHARFALGDRLDIEDRVLARFGKDSRADDRRGMVVIATQVIEQSLDLDFDVMVSDLAPIDLLIQRAGRLCRHARDAEGNPFDPFDKLRASCEQRGPPRLYVFGPEPLEAPPADWFKAFLPGAAAVYPHHGQLWLTTRLLQERGAIVMPGEARTLIEGVYGDDAQERIPPALQPSRNTQEGQQMSHRAEAANNACKLSKGYTLPGFNLWEDTQVFTRLGDPTVTVRLARWENGELQPWRQADRFAWELSQVSVRASRFREEAVPEEAALRQAIETCRASMSDQGRWSKLLVLRSQADGSWAGEAIDGQGEKVTMRYDTRMGLRWEKG